MVFHPFIGRISLHDSYLPLTHPPSTEKKPRLSDADIRRGIILHIHTIQSSLSSIRVCLKHQLRVYERRVCAARLRSLLRLELPTSAQDNYAFLTWNTESHQLLKLVESWAEPLTRGYRRTKEACVYMDGSALVDFLFLQGIDRCYTLVHVPNHCVSDVVISCYPGLYRAF